MDIYKWLFGPSGKAALENPDTSAGLLAGFREQIATTELPMLGAVMMDAGVPVAPVASRLGGVPWWPVGMVYPTAADGAPLALLIQVNFADAPKLRPFPEAGLLQVFIAADDLYGCNVDDVTRSTGFRCVYHTDLSRPSLADFSFLDGAADRGFLPL